MNDKMREEFEAWAVSMGFELRGHNGNYLKEIHCAWMAWKASRAVLVVELPDTAANTGTLTSSAVLSYKRDCRTAIQTAGVSVK